MCAGDGSIGGEAARCIREQRTRGEAAMRLLVRKASHVLGLRLMGARIRGCLDYGKKDP